MDHQGDGRGDQRGLEPELIPKHQIRGHYRWNNGAADVDGENRAGPRHHDRRDITHAEEFNDLSRFDGGSGQHRDRNIEIAADQRAEQQKKGHAGTDPEPHIGISENPKLNQDEQYHEQQDQDRKQSRCQRQIVNLGTHDFAGSIPVVCHVSIIDFPPHGKSLAEQHSSTDGIGHEPA